ncbi:MAG TPA: hypothetical protein VNU01_12945, partial [Egibacteraceae bacterium]|nr:hypothetical protein [Egibacteraceae bacterium]
TTGGDAGSDEPTMVGTGPDTPVSSDDLPGSDDPASVVHEPDAGEPPVEETDTEPASASGLDGGLLAAIAAGLVGLVFAGWWLRRDA